MTRFANKTVIVTGAGSGIGAGVAKRFAAEGANVVFAGRTREKLEKAAGGIEPTRVLIQVADVSKPKDVDKLVAATVKRFGAIDVLVNNAGVFEGGKLEDTDFAAWDKVIAVDVSGVFYCCKAVMPHLLTSKGSIVNVSSVSGLGGDWGASAYNAAKGAVTNMTRSLALEFGLRGVRVNAVNPSFTKSEMTADMQKDKKLVAKFNERIAMGRPADPDDIAGPVLFLASDDARYVTGVNLPVDGGLSASNGQPNFMG